MTPLVAAALIAWTPPLAPTIRDVTPTGIRDMSFTARILNGVQRELIKINKDFAQSYKFTTTKVRMREPFMMRLEATVDDTAITFVVNGAKKLIKVPRSKINLKQDVSKSPGKRQTILDWGMITPSLFTNLYEAKFVREDRATKDLVFDFTYFPNLKDGTRNRVWIDPDKKYITKREWYSQIDGRLQATFVHAEPKNFNGIWVPMRTTVRNADDKVAGVTVYEAVQVNSGLAESLFEID